MSKRTVADVVLSPSLMCTDLLSLSDSVRELEEIGVDALHIDLIDSTFSPSMPLGLEVIRQLREKTNLDFDIHIMSMNNEWFIKQALDIGVRRVSFHYEMSLHPDRLVNLIKKQKVEAGIALNPATSLRSLDYLLPSLDYVLLMLINPGFASNKDEQQVPYAEDKVRHLHARIAEAGTHTAIQVDGRVSFATIPGLVAAGASNLVLGSTGLFFRGATLMENKSQLNEKIAAGLAQRAKGGVACEL
ncbi:ribulose-phosphate 3-epimerase [Salmonella enterica]|nr:ribulose-phosphate 3-epimerase [Salmonella enterica]ELJ5334957.1 ribulose-phosphate 3-epimerase [Salmonella enterica]ELJ5337583.1 ribulose-phosphate 3-epimerase [Salmonella enterica]